MGKMTGNEFLVKALQEEGVVKIFGYPGACVIDPAYRFHQKYQ